MKTRNISIVVLFAVITLLSACKKKKSDEVDPEATAGALVVKFDHKFDGVTFALNTEFKTENEDSLKFTKFNYYVSNVKLKKSDGSVWDQPESYYLINFSEAVSGVCSITLADVPSGDYTDMTFTLGVDSTRNVSGAQTGALDPANGMFWSWNSGYIFSKAEGTYKNVSSGSFVYHIGGFKDATNVNALQTTSFNFGPLPATVNSNVNPQIHLEVDVKTMFSGSGVSLDVVATPTCHMPGAMAKNISKNFVEMFEFEHVHN